MVDKALPPDTKKALVDIERLLLTGDSNVSISLQKIAKALANTLQQMTVPVHQAAMARSISEALGPGSKTTFEKALTDSPAFREGTPAEIKARQAELGVKLDNLHRVLDHGLKVGYQPTVSLKNAQDAVVEAKNDIENKQFKPK